MTITSRIIDFDQEIFDTLWNQCNKLLYKNLGHSVDKFLAEGIFKTSDIILTTDNNIPVILSATKVYNNIPTFVFCLFGDDSTGTQSWFQSYEHISSAIETIRGNNTFVDIVVKTNSPMHNGLINSLETVHSIKQKQISSTHTRLRFVYYGNE